jgi:hypothetical protein
MFSETVGWDKKLGLLCCSSELACLFCKYWLNDRMMDSMTHIIAAYTQERPENTKVFFVAQNLYWYTVDKDWKWNKTANNITHLQDIGSCIEEGTIHTLVVPVNPRGCTGL